jgi:hypothetical protein
VPVRGTSPGISYVLSFRTNLEQELRFFFGMATRPIRPSQFGAGAPPKNLTLPQGNVTLYEQLVFLPNSVRNLEVVLRFAYNGVHEEAVSRIIEHGRILPKDTGCTINTALKIMQHGPRFRLNHVPGSGDKWNPAKAFKEDRPDD